MILQKKQPIYPNKFKYYGNLQNISQEIWTPVSSLPIPC